jgi:predicted HicB family RNase H-like nuclease
VCLPRARLFHRGVTLDAVAPRLTSGKNLAQMQRKREPANVRFGDLKRVCEQFFGKLRQPGTSHANFKRPWAGDSGSTSDPAKAGPRHIGSSRFCWHSKNRKDSPASVDHYTCRVTWPTEDREHAGLCAEFPSLPWLASTREAALKGIRQLVVGAVADMRASGEPVPAPLAERRYSGEFRVRIPPEVHRALAIQPPSKVSVSTA